MSDFLDNLKKAADTGEFNSEAAKKILDINTLADVKLGKGSVKDIERLSESVDKEFKGKAIPVTEEEALELNSDYEKKMEEFKKQDFINSQLAILIDIEDMVKASVGDMFSFVDELESKFEKEFEEENPIYSELFLKIEKIKLNFKPIIN